MISQTKGEKKPATTFALHIPCANEIDLQLCASVTNAIEKKLRKKKKWRNKTKKKKKKKKQIVSIDNEKKNSSRQMKPTKIHNNTFNNWLTVCVVECACAVVLWWLCFNYFVTLCCQLCCAVLCSTEHKVRFNSMVYVCAYTLKSHVHFTLKPWTWASIIIIITIKYSSKRHRHSDESIYLWLDKRFNVQIENVSNGTGHSWKHRIDFAKRIDD